MIHLTPITEEELKQRWEFHDDLDNDDPWLALDEERIDVWESCTNLQLYSTKEEAQSAAEKFRQEKCHHGDSNE